MSSIEADQLLKQQMLVTQNLRASHKIISKLEMSKASTEIMVDRLPDTYFVVNQDGRILKGNFIAARLLAVDELEELISLSIRTLFSTESWNIFKNKMDRLVKTHEKEGTTDEQFELQLDGEGVEKRAYHWNLRLFEGISDRRGMLICAFGRDITQIRQYEKKLSQIFSVIPLGIATIDDKGFIDGPYSAYAEFLLGVKSLSTSNFYDLVFEPAKPHMSKTEQLGVIELREIFGQEQLWFDLSKKRFPGEIFFPLEGTADGRWLGLSYHPIIKDDIIVKMLVVMEDRTEVVKARKEKDAMQRKENIMMQRIMELQRAEEATLQSSFEDLGSLSLKLKDAFDKSDPRAFCNVLHGIKGIVRTAGFTRFKDLAHDAEDGILERLEKNEPVSSSLLEERYRQITEEFEELRKLRKMQTGSSDDGSAALKEDIKVKASALSDAFNQAMATLGKVADKSSTAFDKLNQAVRAFTHKSLESIESRLLARSAKTCEQLRKNVDLQFKWKGIVVEEGVLSQISEVMTHLITNGISHGIETPEERESAKKSTKGTLQIEAILKGDTLNFTFLDDGAGINPERIKKSCLEKKIVTEGEVKKMSDTDLIQMIFRPGFSTHDGVSEISGRGIGLDSVRSILRSLGGDIEVQKREPYGTCFKFMIKVK